MRLIGAVRHILEADRFVSRYQAEDERRNQEGIGLIAAAAFAVMSVLNIKQSSVAMLATTGLSAAFLLAGFCISRRRRSAAFLRAIFYVIFIVIFTAYTIMGGNEGFAALWLVIATYAVMIAIDFKAGFVSSVYYLAMLLLVFVGPLSPLLRYDYNRTFLLRFPFLYAINFAFATYIVVRIRGYQYELIIKKQELEHLSTFDLSTGLKNRNHFIQDTRAFRADGVETLSAVFLDANGLHEINNREGHAAGDRMLLTIAELCQAEFPEASIYRLGGDEFLILCRNAREDEVSAGARRLSDAVDRAGYSVSYGIGRQTGPFDLTELAKAADAEMIRFKREYYLRTSRENR